MKRSLNTHYSFAAWKRYLTAAAALLALAICAPPAARAQQGNPPVLPTIPYWYSWPQFHGAGVPSPTSVTNPLTDPYYQLMGTPTGVYPLGTPPDPNPPAVTPYVTQIPSYLIGHKSITTPPAIGDGSTFVQNEEPFRWAAPFAFQATTAPAPITVDDSPINTSGFTLSGAWQQVMEGAPSSTTSTVANTATGMEYLRIPSVARNGGSYSSVVWSFNVTVSGNYSLSVHLPVQPDGTEEPRVTDAQYTINASGPAISSLPVTVHLSQQNATGNLFLAGPYALTAGQTVTVTLDNSTANSASPMPYVLADSITLQTGGFADEQSSPTAINAQEFPDIQNALYYGEQPQATDGTSNGNADSTPHGNATVDPNPNGTVDLTRTNPTHAIRQLVYFGRSEVIVDPTTLAATTVGAIYCVDGFTGGVVWRFQTPDFDDASGALVHTSAPVFSSPAVAKITLTPGTTSPVSSPVNKLVVIVGDENGAVYCLDAVGNRDGTSNSNVINTTTNQPIYDTTQPSHVGTTKPYWIYRPDARRPLDYITRFLRTPDPITHAPKLDPASDLPVPTGFGLASPTIVVNPTPSNANDPLPATVYIGNSNGTLFALDPTVVDSTDPTTSAAQSEKYYASLVPKGMSVDAYAPIPTANPVWWFPIRGAVYSATSTSNAAIEGAPAVLHTATGDTIYVGSSHEAEIGSNMGRIYAVSSTGPTGGVPGSPNYNVNARPAWSFPNAYGATGITVRPALGNISGSPVIFTNPYSGTTQLYFAANTGIEYGPGATGQNGPQPRPADDQTGRIWALNVNGVDATNSSDTRFAWAYPSANDPNDSAKDATLEPSTPIGAFLHATPAIGLVQFPSNITYGPSATVWNHSDDIGSVLGRWVPMLYIGTRGVDSTLFYGIDITNSGNAVADDAARFIYNATPANGARFQSSPALIVNQSTRSNDGNGGAVLITAGNSVIQIDATPISNTYIGATGPTVQVRALYTGFGPVSSCSVAASNVFDIPHGTNAAPFDQHIVTDWVYVGDSATGYCRGITPLEQNGGIDLTQIIPTPSPGDGFGLINSNFPLFVQIFDGSTASPYNTNDMSKALPIGPNSPLPVLEWGDSLYYRITNVVPPNPNNAAPELFMYDPSNTGTGSTDADPKDCFYSNGGPVIYTFSDGAQMTGTGSRPIEDPANAAYFGGSNPPLGNAFYPRTSALSTEESKQVPAVFLKDSQAAGPFGWMYAFTDRIGDITGNNGVANAPGGRRYLASVSQQVNRYNMDGTPANPPVVTLMAFFQTDTTVPNTHGTPVTIAGIDQPTYGVANPLALRAGGNPLPLNVPGPLAVQSITGQEVGPFRALSPPATLPSAPTDDLQALGNGNTVYLTWPGTGFGSESPTVVTKVPPTVTYQVATSTSLINHGNKGDNADLGNNGATAPTGNISFSGEGLSGTNYGRYALDVADRSDLGLNSSSLQIQMERTALRWNDNTGQVGTGAVINPLPWDYLPVVGSNTSLDYPDVTSSAERYTLYNNVNGSPQDITGHTGVLDFATTTSDKSHRTVKCDPVQVTVSIPKFQPANLQLYDASAAVGVNPLARSGSNFDPNHNNFPNGYVGTAKVFVDSNHNGVWDNNEAYREVDIYTGVLPSMSMSVDTPTIDVGKVPHGFGIQTDASSIGVFAPVNPLFGPHFIPITAHNTGNVNLMNVHLDQKIDTADLTGAGISPLNLAADPVDPLVSIPSFDPNNFTGPTPTYGKKLLIRSNLDEDLYQTYAGSSSTSGYTAQYQGPTLHKARVGDISPTTLTIPDTPPPGTAYQATNPQLPRVSVAVPLGTPVGTYTQTLRLFEGYDVRGYPSYSPSAGGSNAFTGAYNTMLGPNYGGVMAGVTPVLSPLQDIFYVPGGQAAQSYSDPGVTLKVTVTEDRMTDGSTTGALPQIDAGPAAGGTTSVSNVLASAYRDAFWSAGTLSGSGDFNLAWTTNGRGSASPYDIYGAQLGYHIEGASPNIVGYFLANTSYNWWSPLFGANGLFNNAAYSYSALSFASSQEVYSSSAQSFNSDGKTFAFVHQNGTAAPYAASILALPVTNGAVTTAGAEVVTEDTSLPKYGVRGLLLPASPTFINDASGAHNLNLWAFWYGGTRGHTAIYYSSAAANSDGTFATQFSASGLPFTDSNSVVHPGPAAVLPVPPGLSSVADPSPVFVDPDSAGANVTPYIEVTYSGVAGNGNADIYISRYTPYHPTNADGTVDMKRTLLALAPFKTLNEQLAPDANKIWYQARDVNWLQNGNLNISTISGGVTTPLLRASAGGALIGSITQTYDKASGLWIFSNVDLNGSAGGGTRETIFVDIANGRIRFSPALTGTAPLVVAAFDSLARRITTDARADTTPTAFIDTTWKNNEDRDQTNLAAHRVQTDRYWYIWRKSGGAGASTPTLYYKTQRLTITLLDANGNPIAIPLNSSGQPNITVTAGGTTLYSPGAANVAVDVDWSRGRLYFPIYTTLGGGMWLEGQQIVAAMPGNNYTATIYWLDEPHTNSSGTTENSAALSAAGTGEQAIAMDAPVNEGNVAAILDPFAYANVSNGAYDPLGNTSGAQLGKDQPHNIWLFWNSTRNGTSDLYYETFNPRFSVSSP